MPLEGPKTKEFVKILQGFGFTGRILVVDSSGDRNLMLALRNLPESSWSPDGVNIYDVVNSNVLLFSKESILKVQEVLSR